MTQFQLELFIDLFVSVFNFAYCIGPSTITFNVTTTFNATMCQSFAPTCSNIDDTYTMQQKRQVDLVCPTACLYNIRYIESVSIPQLMHISSY